MGVFMLGASDGRGAGISKIWPMDRLTILGFLLTVGRVLMAATQAAALGGVP